jgi:hypothetical protein
MNASIIWGNSQTVREIATARGANPVVTRYNDGQRVRSVAVSFEGGYDDYNGSCAWAEVPGEYPGETTRFSPRPGKWMSGVRV